VYLSQFNWNHLIDFAISVHFTRNNPTVSGHFLTKSAALTWPIVHLYGLVAGHRSLLDKTRPSQTADWVTYCTQMFDDMLQSQQQQHSSNMNNNFLGWNKFWHLNLLRIFGESLISQSWKVCFIYSLFPLFFWWKFGFWR